MSVILNETKVYPGWELPKNEMAVEEKALLISLKQNYIFLFAKIGAAAGLLLGVYNIFNKYNSLEDTFSLSEILTLVAFYVAAGGLTGYLAGLLFAKIYRK